LSYLHVASLICLDSDTAVGDQVVVVLVTEMAEFFCAKINAVFLFCHVSVVGHWSALLTFSYFTSFFHSFIIEALLSLKADCYSPHCWFDVRKCIWLV